MDFFKQARKQVKSTVKELQSQVEQRYPGLGSHGSQQGGYSQWANQNQAPQYQQQQYQQQGQYNQQNQYQQQQGQYSQQNNYQQRHHQYQSPHHPQPQHPYQHQHQPQQYSQNYSQQQSYPQYQPNNQQQTSHQPHQYSQPHSPSPQASQNYQHYQQQGYPTPQPLTEQQNEYPAPPSNPQNHITLERRQEPSPTHSLSTSQYASAPSLGQGDSVPNPVAQSVSQGPQINQNDAQSIRVQYHPPQPPSNFGSIQPTTPPFNNQIRQGPSECIGYETVLTDYMPFLVLRPELLSAGGGPVIDNQPFAVCGPCFSARVSRHPHLAQSFVPLEKQAQATPRAQITFDRQCVPQGSIQPLIDLCHMSTTWPQCVANESLKEFYGIDEGASVAFCTRCYELFIRHTEFDNHFGKYTLPEDLITWCDIGLRNYAYRVLIAELKTGQANWGRVMSKIQPRLEVDSCTGEGNAIVPAGSGPTYIYGSVTGKPGLFCRECWYEHIAETPLESTFSKYCELEEHQKGTSVCNLATKFSKFAMAAAVRAGDDEVWRRAISMKSQLPLCEGVKGVDEEELQGQTPLVSWYAFKQYPAVEICPHCYSTVVELLGAADLLSPISRPLQNGVVRMCFLTPSQNLQATVDSSYNFENTLAWRGKMLRNALSHGWVSRGDFTALNYSVKVVAAMPPPCGTNARAFKSTSGRTWRGHPADSSVPNDITLTICEECFDHHANGTPLESMLNHDLTQGTMHFSDGFVCNTYSKRAKKQLAEACSQGDWSLFIQYWTERSEVRARYNELLAAMKQQNELMRQENEIKLVQSTQMASIRLMQGLNSNQNAIISGIGGSVAEAAATDYGQRYGNSTVGYGYLTAAGASSAQQWQNLSASQQKTSIAMFQPTGNVNVDSANVLQLFVKLDAEWKAIE